MCCRPSLSPCLLPLHTQSSPLVNYTGANVPATLPRLVTMREGLIIKGNVFVKRHLDPKYAMGLGLDPCYDTGLPCDKPTVSVAC